MNKFVDSYATRQLLPPWRSEGSTCWVFAVPMDKALIQKYLDKYFNGTALADETAIGSPFRYATLPSAQFGLLVVCHQPMICSDLPDAPAGKDALAHDEVYLVIPVRRQKDGKDETTVWVQPFVFGTSSTVLFTTREVVGIEMTWAEICYEFQTADKLHVDVDINGVQKFGPRACSETLNALHIATGPVSKKTLEEFKKADPELGGFLDIVEKNGFIYLPVPLTITASPSSTQPQLEPGPQSSELNTLKQFRDVFDLGSAVYRAIVSCQSSHSDVGGSTYFDPAKVEIDFMWSAAVSEIVALFGITKQTAARRKAAHAHWSGRAPLKARLAFSFKSTVHFSVHETLYTYGD